MFINDKICFVESSNRKDIFFTNSDNSSESDMISYRRDNSPPINIFYNQNLYVTLKIGVFSTLDKVNLIASEFYLKDSEVKSEGLNKPFNDNKNYGNNIKVNCNPVIFKQNIGNNPSEDFDDLFEYPFEDISISLYDRRIPHYRQYVNAFDTHNLSQSISVLGNFEEISGKFITENVFKGVSGFLQNKDARGRSIQITDTFDISDEMNEEFLDQEIENISSESGLIRREFEYVTRVINGEERTVLSIDEGSFSYIKALTNTVLYYNEENILISPFNDSLSAEESTSNIVTTARGVDSDSMSQESITIGRLGEID